MQKAWSDERKAKFDAVIQKLPDSLTKEIGRRASQSILEKIALCTICTSLSQVPVELPGCHHRFCQPCIMEWFTTSGERKCPNCRADAYMPLNQYSEKDEIPPHDCKDIRQVVCEHLGVRGDLKQVTQRVADAKEETKYKDQCKAAVLALYNATRQQPDKPRQSLIPRYLHQYVETTVHALSVDRKMARVSLITLNATDGALIYDPK
jgi:hypothetical protein